MLSNATHRSFLTVAFTFLHFSFELSFHGRVSLISGSSESILGTAGLLTPKIASYLLKPGVWRIY